ncbi:uncharacterized protein LOC127726764 [Mytilus californianus]|uniref:uncharacterized protein LOC127726764 n=1 Tax=Mytilus californianus TaxID=6549 RepID=UPI0022454AF8|nr:uncharacterized protein LOC127726764 [Mytilus californianus]
MRDDQVKAAVLSDPDIILLGMNMYVDHGNQTHRHVYINNKMRELGRLLIELRKHGISSIYEAIGNSNWNTLISSVQELCQFEPTSNTFGIPSLACKVGQSLKNIADDILFQKLKTGDSEGGEIAETFLKLYDLGWTKDISAKAIRTLQMNKYNKRKLLPLVEDVVKISKYIDRRCKELELTSDCYREYCQLILAQIILFNRKSGGETERMTLKNFQDSQCGGVVDNVVLSTLTEFEKNLCKTHLRVEIIGKKNRKVLVLLTETMKKNIMFLIEMRSTEGITSNFLFAWPGEARHPFRGVDALRNVVREADVKHPELLTSTLLRKQMATLAQVLNLSETSQDILATFQGYIIRVHRQFYRLSEETMQVAKVSKLLHCINSGTIARFKGQDFNDITFDVNDELESDNESEQDAEEDKEEKEEIVIEEVPIQEATKKCRKRNLNRSECVVQLKRNC